MRVQTFPGHLYKFCMQDLQVDKRGAPPLINYWSIYKKKCRHYQTPQTKLRCQLQYTCTTTPSTSLNYLIPSKTTNLTLPHVYQRIFTGFLSQFVHPLNAITCTSSSTIRTVHPIYACAQRAPCSLRHMRHHLSFFHYSFTKPTITLAPWIAGPRKSFSWPITPTDDLPPPTFLVLSLSAYLFHCFGGPAPPDGSILYRHGGATTSPAHSQAQTFLVLCTRCLIQRTVGSIGSAASGTEMPSPAEKRASVEYSFFSTPQSVVSSPPPSSRFANRPCLCSFFSFPSASHTCILRCVDVVVDERKRRRNGRRKDFCASVQRQRQFRYVSSRASRPVANSKFYDTH